jgi:cell division protein FtsI (penicillin-binding protein 3)
MYKSVTDHNKKEKIIIINISSKKNLLHSRLILYNPFMNHESNKKLNITFIFLLIFIFFLILFGAILNISFSDKKLPRLKSSETDKALKGNILTKEEFTISTSKKLYKAVVDTREIDPEKAKLFVKLFSIYSGMDEREVTDKITSRYGFVTISYRLDSKSARYLKQLTSNLYSLHVFKKIQNSKYLHGLSIKESGEYREYPLHDTLTPIIGYVRKYEKNRYTIIKGAYGLEKYYADKLEGIQSTKIVGRRDVRNKIILDKDSEVKNRIDGYDIITSINIRLQKKIEQILDAHQIRTESKEIIASVMDSQTGDIVAIASSRRFIHGHITNPDALTISAIRYIFEPGSVLKPIIFSLLLEENRIQPTDIVRTYNGEFKLGKKTITDEHRYAYLSAENVIVHSSNIGMAQISQELDAIAYFEGLRAFGFSQPSGIDLPYDLSGSIPGVHRLKNSVIKATASYGYGIKANFFQLLKAYNVFNNEGKILQPTIAKYLKSDIHPKELLHNKKAKQIISKQNARIMKKILYKTVTDGTGKGARTKGLIIGGKTGTAQIAIKGRYENVYNSSFFGFVDDGKHKYTLGVTVIEPQPEGSIHFASQSAVPVFKDIINIMIDQKLIKPLPTN